MGKDKTKKVQRNEESKDAQISRLTAELSVMTGDHAAVVNNVIRLTKELTEVRERLEAAANLMSSYNAQAAASVAEAGGEADGEVVEAAVITSGRTLTEMKEPRGQE